MTKLVESSKLNTSSNSETNPQRLKFELVHHDHITFIVKLHFGNPAIPLYFLPDTGSHLFWTQCECTHRFRQLPPIYNSSASHTYVKLPCEHPFCRNHNSTFQCERGECVYRINYMEGSMSEGVTASDIFLTFDNTQIQIYFGCSKNNQNFRVFELIVGKIGGIMGLSMSPVSLLQQLANITQCSFCYCLPPLSTQGNGSSLLRFGDEIITRGRTFKLTPLYLDQMNTCMYFLNLRDISIESYPLNLPPNTFARTRNGSGGCIIDSGTSFTRLILPAYRLLLWAFQVYYGSYGLIRVHAPETGFELCYKMSARLPKYASMTYHFEGADFKVGPQYLHMKVPDQDDFCVEILSEQRQTVLGAMQQINMRFIYHARARQILFSPENCEHDI